MKAKWITFGRILIILLLALAVGMTFRLSAHGAVQAQDPQPPQEGLQPQGEVSIQALMGTAFTYQGQLERDGNLVNENCDFQFSLWDAAGSGSPPTGGTQIGGTNTKTNVEVSGGIFTIPDLNFGDLAFKGDARWLQIAVRCPTGSGDYTTLSPRQKLNPFPYALALPGLYTIQSTTSPNLIGGYSGNSTALGVVGATIGGGGAASHANTVADDYGTIGGGYENKIGLSGSTTDQPYATIAGGYKNKASQQSTTVGGGWQNTANANAATVSGGADNIASGAYSTIGGGGSNTASGGNATIGGGVFNQVTGDWDATVGGGYGNIAAGQGSTVPGGIEARASDYGQMAYASGKFANAGDAQTSVYVVRGITEDDEWDSLYLDGNSRQIFVAPGRTVTFDILVVGRTQGGKSNGYRITGVVENVSGTLSLWYSVSELHEDDTGWDVKVITLADHTLHVQVNGDPGDTIRWVATVRTVEVSW